MRVPVPRTSPLRSISYRVLAGLFLLAVTVAVVYALRGGYQDNNADHKVDLLDAIYYATVSLTTTGYGDITPVSDGARLADILVVTPLRVGFLVIFVGTTIEVLATRSREQWRVAHWRKGLQNHTVVVGYGTKGRSAIRTLLSGGMAKEDILVIDPRHEAVAEANAEGIAAIVGDATRRDVLQRAEVGRATRIIVTAQRDDTAVLVSLNARQVNPDVSVAVAVRESENIPLLRQSGADVVLTSSEAVGRILGMSSISPALGAVLEDLLTYGEGLEVAQRHVLPQEEGRSPRQLDDLPIAVVRDGVVLPYFDPACAQLLRGDDVVVVRSAQELPWAPRPGVDEGADHR